MFSSIKKHPLFSISFRPLFILTALQAILVPTVWISVYKGFNSFEGRFFNAANWHSHEMIYGFTLALISGFLLTASSNWTGKPAFKGTPIIILSLLWIIERVVLLLPITSWIIFPLSSAFLVYFIYLTFLMLKGNKKNLRIFIPLLLIFLIGKSLMLLGPLLGKPHFISWARDIGLALTQLIILVVAGRILPFFANKRHKGINVQPKMIIEHLTLWPCVLFIIPREFMNDYFYFGLNVWAAVFNLLRLAQYKPIKTIKNQMLLILNSGYLWMIIAFALNAWGVVNPTVNFSLAPLHAFAMGALGCFTLGMLCRVSLGHTGRKIDASWFTIFAFYCIHIGTLYRVIVPIFIPSWYLKSLHHAAGWWTLAFCFYVLEYTLILWRPRPDGK